MTTLPLRDSPARAGRAPSVWLAGAVLVAGSLLAAQSVHSWMSSQNLANQFVSATTWARGASWLSGKPVPLTASQAEIPFIPVLKVVFAVHMATWFLGAVPIKFRRKERWDPAFNRWRFYGGLWWCLLGLWDWISIALQMCGAESLVSLWGLVPSFWCAICIAGWMTTWLVLFAERPAGSEQPAASLPPVNAHPSTFNLPLWSFIACYLAVFVTMNWRLYFNLLIPHGDSAMYEEHLWNVLHGKGFRSYLDQGLFLGEHIQFVHLGLLPAYLVWPSHLLLEFCESLALALGAWPVYWMTRRHSGSHRAGLAAAAAYLLYPPLQFLDIEIDLKTFRPEAFGIPIFLLTLDQLDRRNLRGTLIGILGCLTVKEDYAIVLAPLGVWIAATEGGRRKAEGGSETAATVMKSFDRRWLIFGVLLAVGSVAYLYVATRVLMPWFRSGAEIHYANYFSRFGQTPEQIVRTMLTNPGMLFGELMSTTTVLYVLALLVPLAFLPLLSPGRLAVGLPLFGILCLNELARDPRHQFHAPLVAIVFWALSAAWQRGISLLSRALEPIWKGESLRAATIALPHLAWTSSLAMGLFFSLHPLSLTFWDAGSEWHWRKLYGPSQRAAEFAKIADLIPRTARVASTDFVHPRYTHFERSYDYSKYRRKVSGYEEKVPEDTDYIVIDTQHRYSDVKSPADVPEFRDHAEEWELLPDRTDGFFIVLKRKTAQE